MSDIMRTEYRELSDVEFSTMKEIKRLGSTFHTYCDTLKPSREASLAKTKIEEAVMWAVKAITG